MKISGFLILFSIVLIPASVEAQTVFRDSIYDKVDTTTHFFTTQGNTKLGLDFYRPAGNKDTLPLIVYVHGGGFYAGARDEKQFQLFAHRLACRGYAVACVSYRLTMKGVGLGCNVAASRKINAFNAASYDVSKAIEFIVKNNDQHFKIDPKTIILAGSSAGAETILNMAYVYENPVLDSNVRFAGVISMAGGATTVDKMDSSRAIPGQFFHGTKDPYVPYDSAPHHFCSSDKSGYLILHGSATLAKKLKELGSAYYLYTSVGGSHRWAGAPLTLCFEDIVDFLFNDVIEVKTIRQTEQVVQDFR